MQLARGRKDGSILIPSCYNIGLMSCHPAERRIWRGCFIIRKIWYLEMMLEGSYRICFLYVLCIFLIYI